MDAELQKMFWEYAVLDSRGECIFRDCCYGDPREHKIAIGDKEVVRFESYAYILIRTKEGHTIESKRGVKKSPTAFVRRTPRRRISLGRMPTKVNVPLPTDAEVAEGRDSSEIDAKRVRL